MTRKGANSFAALGSGSDDSSSDEDDEDAKAVTSSTSVTSAMMIAASGDIVRSYQQPQRQAGGSVAMRVDPIVGLDNDKTVDLGLKNGDIEACCRVIEILGKNSNLFKLPALKKLRAALHPLIMEQLKSNYQSTGNAFKDDSEGKRGRKKRKIKDCDEIDRETRAVALETEYINQTQLRAVRMQQLESLNDDGFEVPRVPDGVALLNNGSTSGGLMLTAIGRHLQLQLLNNTASSNINNTEDENQTELREPISCYICHKPYKKLHFFYHQLCPECATFNYRYLYGTKAGQTVREVL